MSENEQQIQNLLVAVTKMEKTQESTIKAQDTTTKNVDKIVLHLEKLLPIHLDIAYVKKILYGLITFLIVVAVPYVAWITIAYFTLQTEFRTFKAVQEEKNKEVVIKHEEITKDIASNKTQVAYVKGRIK